MRTKMGVVARLVAISLVGLLGWLALPPLNTAFALSSGDYHLRSGAVLSPSSPTATTAQFKDSPAVNRTTYQEIGIWTATANTTTLRLSETTAAHVWLGLKNSDDQGTYFDLRAELRKNGVVIASGETKNIQGITRNANQAKEVTVSFGTPVNAQFNVGDVLSVRVLAKVADSGGHNNAVGVRLYYDALSRPARLGTTFVPVNTPPTSNAGPDQTQPIGSTVHLDGTASSDPDGDPLTFAWSLITKPNGSTATLSNATTALPTFVLDKAGAYHVQLVVSDGDLSSTADIVIISTLNSVPVADAGADQSGTVNTVIHLDGSDSSDVDGDPLTYEWSFTSQPATSTATLTNSTSVTPQFTLDTPGTYVVQLIVHDGTVASVPDTVTISTINSPPVANAGADQSGTVGTTLTLDGSGSSDVDGDALTYHWALTSQPANSTATLSDPTAVNPTLLLDKPGAYTAQLIVHDGTVASAPDTVTLSTLNTKPVAEAGTDQHGTVGTTITLDGTASSDPDGDALTYQWSLTTTPSDSTTVLQNPTAAMPSFVLDKPGTYTGQLMVNDGQLDSAPDTVTVTTLNSQPVAEAGAEQTGQTGIPVQLDGSGSHDVDNNLLTYF